MGDVAVLLALHPCPASVDRLSVDRSPTRADTRRSSRHLIRRQLLFIYTNAHCWDTLNAVKSELRSLAYRADMPKSMHI